MYSELAHTAGIKRICDSDNKFVRLTEHIIDENTAYAVAINYNNKDEKASIIIDSDFKADVVYGSGFEGNKTVIRENDSIILKLERKR